MCLRDMIENVIQVGKEVLEHGQEEATIAVWSPCCLFLAFQDYFAVLCQTG